MSPQFSPSTLANIETLKRRYPDGQSKSALLPILHMAQGELGGHLSREVMDYVASILNIQPIEVYEVATFYTMFHLQPTGKYILEVCRTGPCSLVGAEKIIEYLKQKLGVELNQITPDGLFTIKEVECLASCGSAPMLQVGECYVEHLTEAKVDEMLAALKAGSLSGHEPNPKHSILFRTRGETA
ncbi:NAD(P)H-dependent oxidoreductase subunit E [bacterium]|nr:NAD(P)H-dependent oxidoreductase subunit E [bacterium]